MTRLGVTPSQTVGPYFGMRLFRDRQNVLRGPDTEGEPIRLEGCVYDGDGKIVEDALIELWQADARGFYRHPADVRGKVADQRRLQEVRGFSGFGRAATDFASGLYWFDTIRPGRVPDDRGALSAPHLNLMVHARGMLRVLFTRVYFADEAALNEQDRVLRSAPADRRATLIAEPTARDGDEPVYRFDIRLQGAGETVFFRF